MVPNELRLEKDLDQIYIGSMKLFVNLPKYRRNGNTQQGATLYADGKGKNQLYRAQGQSKSKEV